jgi:hypothetical protein
MRDDGVSIRYKCSGCGAIREDGQQWLTLRLSGDRRGVEIRPFEYCGPDDEYFCSETCAFERISEMFGGMRPAR